MEQMVRPVVLTSLTTAIGFLSFLFSPIEAVRAFGIFAAAGILFCMLWSLTFIPATLTLIAPDRLRRHARGSGYGSIPRWFAPLIGRPGLVLAAVLVVTLAALFGLRRLHVQDSWIDGFAPDSPFRRATEQVNSSLHGTHLLLVHLSFPVAGEALLEPSVLEAIGDFEAFLRRQAEVGGVLGTHTHLTVAHYLLNARRSGTRSLPRDARGVKRLLIYFDNLLVPTIVHGLYDFVALVYLTRGPHAAKLAEEHDANEETDETADMQLKR